MHRAMDKSMLFKRTASVSREAAAVNSRRAAKRKFTISGSIVIR